MTGFGWFIRVEIFNLAVPFLLAFPARQKCKKDVTNVFQNFKQIVKKFKIKSLYNQALAA
jgi:hypothetical protein